MAFCKSLLSRVPKQLGEQHEPAASRRCSSRACRSIRSNPKQPDQGGTQDNGTLQYGGSSRTLWPQIIYGDGGQSGFSATNDALRFNTFTGQANDANFRNGDPTKWVIISAPIYHQPRGRVLLPAGHRRPEPGERGHDLPGLVQSSGARRTGAATRPSSRRTARSSRRSAAKPGCGDFVRDRPGGRDRPDGQRSPSTTAPIAAAARSPGSSATPSNTGTMWAATGDRPRVRHRQRECAGGVRRVALASISIRCRERADAVRQLDRPSIRRTRITRGSRTRATTSTRRRTRATCSR